MTQPNDDMDVEGEPSGRTSLVDRLLPPVDQRGEDGQPKPSRMDRREQLVAAGLGFANVAVAGGAAAAMDRQQALAVAGGVVASAFTVAGARLGNRVVAILGLFACVAIRNAETTAFLVLAIPYYAAAMWIFLRYNRMMRAHGLRKRQQRAAAKTSTAATGARTSGKGTSKGTSAASTAKGRPSASKRYTPPKAKKRPPKPPKPPRDRSIVD